VTEVRPVERARSAALDPLALYAAGLDGAPVYVRHADGRRELLPTRRWTGGLQAGDEGLLDRCVGPTLDVGCGPGRLTTALQRRGLPVLGIDVSAVALRLARGAGACVLQRDVFDDLPGDGRWSSLLLADGNLGIGGDPVRLLARCHDLIAPSGLVLAELSGVSTASTAIPGGGWGSVRLEDATGRVSTWFPWGSLDAAGIGRAAGAAGLRVTASWTAVGRSFVALARWVPVQESAGRPAAAA
jgi:SAM-dependent methyltransferase